jgi:hypothetical protein
MLGQQFQGLIGNHIEEMQALNGLGGGFLANAFINNIYYLS